MESKSRHEKQEQIMQTAGDQLKDTAVKLQTKTNLIILAVYFVLIAMGVGTGLILSKNNSIVLGATSQNSKMINSDKVIGSTDAKTFKDSVVGVIQKGGIDGEGTHQLLRDGGPSQTAYLFSSVIDLDQYIGKKVKVFGQTMAAQKAAWLMDVGKIEFQQ